MNLLPKLSYYVPLKILNQFILYYSTHIRDRETEKIQNKAVNILKSPNLSNLFEIKWLWNSDIVALSNYIFPHDQTKKNLPYVFKNYFCKKKSNTKIRQVVFKMNY